MDSHRALLGLRPVLPLAANARFCLSTPIGIVLTLGLLSDPEGGEKSVWSVEYLATGDKQKTANRSRMV